MSADRIATIARAVVLLEQGHSYGSAAEALGCSRSQVQRYEDSARIIRERAKQAAELDEAIKRAREDR